MKTAWKDYVIESKFVGEKNSSWDRYSSDRHHVITVMNVNTGDSLSFDYWTSRAHPKIDSEEELLEALECYFVDADYGEYSFEEFCREQGYDVPDGIYESWKACKKANAKMKNVVGDGWTYLANTLREEIES